MGVCICQHPLWLSLDSLNELSQGQTIQPASDFSDCFVSRWGTHIQFVQQSEIVPEKFFRNGIHHKHESPPVNFTCAEQNMTHDYVRLGYWAWSVPVQTTVDQAASASLNAFFWQSLLLRVMRVLCPDQMILWVQIYMMILWRVCSLSWDQLWETLVVVLFRGLVSSCWESTWNKPTVCPVRCMCKMGRNQWVCKLWWKSFFMTKLCRNSKQWQIA